MNYHIILSEIADTVANFEPELYIKENAKIKAKQLKEKITLYEQSVETYHYENFPYGPKGKSLCGISIATILAEEEKYNKPRKSVLKCPGCQIVLQQYVRLQTIYYYMEENTCTYCGSKLSSKEMQSVITKYLNANSYKKDKLLRGKISWKCKNPACSNEEEFTVNLEEV